MTSSIGQNNFLDFLGNLCYSSTHGEKAGICSCDLQKRRITKT